MTQQLPICVNVKDFFANAGNVLVPRVIYLYRFPDNKDIKEAFESGSYTVIRAILEEKGGVLDMSFLWKKYVNRISPRDYSYKYYVDEKGESYLVQLEAIARRKKFPDGSLPIACKTLGYNCYADVTDAFSLPGCFK